jgi:hypothetical protein
VCELEIFFRTDCGWKKRVNRGCRPEKFPVLTLVTSWYCRGYPPSPWSIEIIELRRISCQVFDSKGFNLQSIQNKGVGGASNLCFPLGSMTYNLLSLAKYRFKRAYLYLRLPRRWIAPKSLL